MKNNKHDLIVFAHRGVPRYYPENTLPSFQKAAELGADYLEMDVHLTKDRQFVIMHDASADRTTNGAGKICEFTLEEIKTLDTGYAFTPDGINYPFRNKGISIMTLEELFINFPDSCFNIDLKDDDASQVMMFADLVRKYDAISRIIVASKHSKNLKELRRICPEVSTSYSVPEAALIYLLHRCGLLFLKKQYPAIAMQIPAKWRMFNIVTKSFINMLHKKNIQIHVWTINKEEEMKRLIDIGVDGIFTDDTEKLMKVLGRL